MSDVSDVPRFSTSDVEDVSDVSYVLQSPLFLQRDYNIFCIKLLLPLCSYAFYFILLLLLLLLRLLLLLLLRLLLLLLQRLLLIILRMEIRPSYLWNGFS